MKSAVGLFVCCSSVWLLAACATYTGGSREAFPELTPYLGLYSGSFDSALTEDPGDDLNHNVCGSGSQQPCSARNQPLSGIFLDLRRQPDGTVSLTFFRDRSDVDAGRPLDLLGFGCGTRLGPMASLEPAEGGPEAGLVAVFPLTTENAMCLGKLRPTSEHHVRLELAGSEPDPRLARVVIDKSVRDDNYLYVEEDGVRRRARIDLDNTIREDHVTRYRVCIEDDLGEYDRCVLTDREFRSFALPLPLPGGGVGVSYTWWQELHPKLRRTQGRYVVEQYVGRFQGAGP